MTRPILSILLGGLLVICFSQDISHHDHATLLRGYESADKVYQQAETIFVRSGDQSARTRASQLFLVALKDFNQLLRPVLEAGYDSLAFFIHLRTATIHYYLDSMDAAQNDYRAALEKKKQLPAIADSFLFKPYLFTARMYHDHDSFDSALIYYKKAEQVHDKYEQAPNDTLGQDIDGASVLYSRLAMIHEEAGDYRQAKVYLEKSIALSPPATAMLVDDKLKIGYLLTRLEEFEQAKQVYDSIVPDKDHSNEIFYNLGIIHFHLDDPSAAIGYFRKVNYDNDKKNIGLWYNYARAFAATNETDSVNLYYQKAIDANFLLNNGRKNIPFGLLLKFNGDQLNKQGRYYEAIQQYQQAILQFDSDFNNGNIYENPNQYNGNISFVNLYDALVAKAAAFEKIQKDKNRKALEAALNAYQSAFELSDFIEKNYNSDESRLFLERIKPGMHNKPINVSLELFELTQQKNYLDEAYLFDQRDKAALLSQNVADPELDSVAGLPKDLLKQELFHKSAVTRLSLRVANANDSLADLQQKLQEHQSELVKLQREIAANSHWQKKSGKEPIPSPTDLQQLLDKTTAILSFHLSGNELLTLLITPEIFNYERTAVQDDLLIRIDSFKRMLSNNNSKKYDPALGKELYQILIAPCREKLSSTNRLIIIPGAELNNLPFEALQDEKSEYLVENFSIQYQYSTALIGKQTKFQKPGNILTVAPFAKREQQDEVSNITGELLLGSAATKNRFIATANGYDVLHVVAPASVNNDNPLQSFISFYPSGNEEYKLYAKEIYNLQLDSTRLIIVSGSDTVDNHPSNGEGIMSLSRAFAYAGCPAMIASLWKTENKTTAFITKQLDNYLAEGYSKDKALQKARIDLLNSKEIEPQYKTPKHWANLVLIGPYEPPHQPTRWLLIAAIAAVAVAVIILIVGGSSLR